MVKVILIWQNEVGFQVYERVMMKNLYCLVLLFISLLAHSSNKQEEINLPGFKYLPSIENTRYFLHHSNILNHDYHIYVRLPKGYDENSTKKYPTVYLLDGGTTFPMLASYYQYLSFAEELPEIIIVGISYGTDDFKKGNVRSTDFTAPSEERAHYGGASAFQNMLKNELFSRIENTFPSDSKRRIIFGQSLGGQFVIYNALSQPENFWGHIASNPALHRNLDFFLNTEIKGLSQTKLFVSRAQNNGSRFKVPEQKWLSFWHAKTDKHFELKDNIVRNHNHFSVAPDSFRNGLLWLFDTSGE